MKIICNGLLDLVDNAVVCPKGDILTSNTVRHQILLREGGITYNIQSACLSGSDCDESNGCDVYTCSTNGTCLFAGVKDDCW